MLAKPDAKVVFDESGKAIGVSSEGETAKCKKVVGDPSYFPGKVSLWLCQLSLEWFCLCRDRNPAFAVSAASYACQDLL